MVRVRILGGETRTRRGRRPNYLSASIRDVRVGVGVGVGTGVRDINAVEFRLVVRRRISDSFWMTTSVLRTCPPRKTSPQPPLLPCSGQRLIRHLQQHLTVSLLPRRPHGVPFQQCGRRGRRDTAAACSPPSLLCQVGERGSLTCARHTLR